MPKLIVKLNHLMPGIRIKQYSAPRHQLIKMLRSNIVDFVLCCPPIEEIDFETKIVWNELPVVIYPRKHWLEGRKAVTLSEIKDESFVGVSKGYGARDGVEKIYAANGIQPNFIMETADTSSVQQYVYNGLGIALVAKALIRQDSYFSNHYVPLMESPDVPLSLNWDKNRIFNKIDQLFFDTAIQYFRSLRKYMGDDKLI